MKSLGKTIVILAYLLSLIYVVLFNVNAYKVFNNLPIFMPWKYIEIIILIALPLAIASIYFLINDLVQRNRPSKALWMVYILLLWPIGVPHYYIKYGIHPRTGHTGH